MAKPAYGAEHQRRRREMLPGAYNTPCPECGHPMLKGQNLELDHHTTPLAFDPDSKGDRIVCADCNAKAGGRLGQRMRQLRPSRKW